jgi:hypothetical protein
LLAAHPVVRAAWLFRDQTPADFDEDDSDPEAEDYKPDVPDYVLGLLVADGFTKELEAEIERVANGTFQAPQRCRIWNMDPADSALVEIMGEYPEFYAAPGFLRCEVMPGPPVEDGSGPEPAAAIREGYAWEPVNDLERAYQTAAKWAPASRELFRQMRESTLVFLMPYHPEMDGELQVGNGSVMTFDVWNNGQEECIPIFTSQARAEQALKVTKRWDLPHATGEMRGQELFHCLTGQKEDYKVVINPGCMPGGMVLDQDRVRELWDGSVFKALPPVTKVRRAAEIVDAADYPTDFIQPLFEFLRSKPLAQAAWLFRQSPPPKTGVTSYIIGLLTTGETGSELEQDLMVVGESVCPPDCSFGVTILDLKKPSVAQVAATFPPCYAAPGFSKPVGVPDAKKI